MPLQSALLRGNARLQQCLISDPDHLTQGSRGAHVGLIQSAVSFLQGLKLDEAEQAGELYGPSTAAAVLAFKTTRNIVNPAYQSKPDSIVGKRTIDAMDKEMRAREVAGARALVALKMAGDPPKTVILSETANKEFVGWADQLVRENSGRVVKVDAVSDPTGEVSRIQQAVDKAGAGGLLILSVGHGVCIPQFDQEGAFDLAPGGTMRIIGRNFSKDQPKDFATPFYADRPPKAPGGGLAPVSEKDKDERNPTGSGEARRLRNFALWEQVCNAIANGNLAGVLLFTCKIGGAPGLLRRIAQAWRTPVIAYTDQVGAFESRPKRFRAILAGDTKRFNEVAADNTNTPMGEAIFPLSLTKMVVIRP